VVSAGERSASLSGFVLLCQLSLALAAGREGSVTRMLADVTTRVCRLSLVKFFAEISYSLYLIHLLVALPVFGYVFSHPAWPSPAGSPAIWLGYTGGVLGISAGISYLTYLFIEQPGIALGKRVVSSRLLPPPQAR
jgi:peptidoglycan/LPS O-acetylase OafA/YrhL